MTKKTIAARMQQLFRTLTSSSLHTPPLPFLPFDLITDILCRLPVKFLIQFQCVCKSWNSLISDPKFAEKHCRLSTTRLVHTLTFSNLPYKHILKSYPLHSVFIDLTTNQTAHPITQLETPSKYYFYFVGSCNGILCLLACDYAGFVSIRLWNPSIRKFKELPYLQKQEGVMYGFGYDAVTNNYKVVVVLRACYSSGNSFEVNVYTLSTDSWKSLQIYIMPSFKFQGKMCLCLIH
ncbi:putative F-box domain, galactose oxidase/kelch, beta-propeller, F-box associated interaction [Medicago truncatula]|uniref:F-box protein interaction domain protein n=1 Tax=Medicago truncatula TaxID=3880 RepID=G7L9D5_MEDTR|nr:F-box/kelch-repeat protein At3g23880-like [Medicago truncatula]AET03603.1 F-box protein interaction domain protein [Medicago truncatula]RHN41854.1 putative F-box domain, galactose oxidase/kelch, beta-propeller, F-box associated interaction [Medicago truncatula]